jgi:uncharacterized integral membrane protein
MPVTEQEHPEGERIEPPPSPEPTATPFSQQVGRVVIGIVVVLFGVFAVANAQPVDFSWIFGETRVQYDQTGEAISGGVPLIVLLLVAFVLGLVLGLVVAWQGARARRRRADEQ